jgi:RimJ/RimL family protein N-acetyltransferase
LRRAFSWARKKPESDEHVVIKGEKVILRDKRVEDAPDDYAWRVDEELSRLDATRPLDMSYEEFLRYSRDELIYPNPRSRRFAIDTHKGKHIGNCMYYDIDTRQAEAELGIMIGDREYWGKGYGTDAVKAILDYIFTATPLERVYLHTLEWNQRARRSFAKAGFHEVRKVRRSGMDFIYMEVWRSEWDRHKRLSQQSATDGRPAERQADV